MAALGKARRITTYLCNSLQNEGGEISARLRSLYVYCFENIGRASLEKDASLLPGVKRVIEELMEGWMELADSQAPGIEKPIEEETP
jgi:flagellar biosynthetic protein FliS